VTIALVFEHTCVEFVVGVFLLVGAHQLGSVLEVDYVDLDLLSETG
jgi:hypothetical protein